MQRSQVMIVVNMYHVLYIPLINTQWYAVVDKLCGTQQPTSWAYVSGYGLTHTHTHTHTHCHLMPVWFTSPLPSPLTLSVSLSNQSALPVLYLHTVSPYTSPSPVSIPDGKRKQIKSSMEWETLKNREGGREWARRWARDGWVKENCWNISCLVL